MTTAAKKTLVKLRSTRVDAKREADGDWKDAITIPGVSFKVRSLTFPAFTIARDIAQQKLRRKYGGKPIPDREWVETHGRLYAEHILLDWKGFAGDEDQEIPYSKEQAEDILTDFEYRLIVSAVEMAAGQMAQADLEFVEEAGKN